MELSVSLPGWSCGTGGPGGSPATGSRTTTVVPTPGAERMRMAPPCSSTSDLAMASPSPEP